MKLDETPYSLTEFDEKIDVLRRQLHVIALLLDGNRTWNAAKLAEYLIEWDPDADKYEDGYFRKTIRLDVHENIPENFGIEFDKVQGGRKTSLETAPDNECLLKLLRHYSVFIAHDTSRDIALKRLIGEKRASSMPMLAEIHFATLNKRKIEFTYTKNDMQITRVRMNPYHLFLHSGKLYLVGRRDKDRTVGPYIADRIDNLKITETVFDDEVPLADSFFAHSFGPFIWNHSEPVEVHLRYTEVLENRIRNDFFHLDPEIKRCRDYFEMRFRVHDYENVCRHLVFYGGDVEILSPEEVRNHMISMLRGSLAVYDKP